jgi:hypothetical protein
MMVRPKARKRPWLIISSVSILTLAVLSGAVFFLLPKISAASTNQSTGSMGNSAQTLNTTNTTGNVNKTGQVAAQPTQAAPTMTTQGSNAPTTANGTNTQPTPATGATNSNQATTQNAAVPLITFKQYVPDIRHMVAQNLNITDKALALQLQSGMHLKDIAMQHGLSNTQLENVLSSSISLGFQPAINAGNLTQMQVASFIQQTQLNPTTFEQQLSILPAAVAHW